MTHYEDMPQDSKVWIYQSNREFRDSEVDAIRKRMKEFMEDWAAHGKQLNAFGDVYYNRFVVIVVNEIEVQATGCSIDKSVHLIKEICETFDVDLFDRLSIAYMKGLDVYACDKTTFQQKVENGEVDDKTLLFNNLVNTKALFETEWKVPLKDHFLSKNISIN